jgi:hypothetical protein
MELIKTLVNERFYLFNVGEKKQPINIDGKGLDKWEQLSVDELVKHHNYNSQLWGMKMGLQENGRRILSLDFDCCGKSNKEKTERLGCPLTKSKLKEYWELVDVKDGMYSSSTKGNMNVLIDYTDCEHIIGYVNQIASNKFNFEGFEILLGGNQVIPPSATKCKISQKKGQARAFISGEPFYKLNDESVVYDYIKQLFQDKIKTVPKKVKIEKMSINDETDNESVSSEPSSPSVKTDKWLKLLFDVIKNERDAKGCKIISRDYWFQILGILKYNGYDKKIWLEFSGLISNSNTASKTWDGIKNTTPMDRNGLRNIAKDINFKGYKQWINAHEMNLYNPLFTSALIADYFKLLYDGTFVCVDDSVYYYNGVYWEKEDKKNSNLIKFIDKTFMIDLLEYANGKMAFFTSQLSNTENAEITKANISKVTELLKNINSMRKVGVRKSIIDDIVTFITNNNVEFDNNPYLFAFNNCVYDLKLGTFVKPQHDFWISKTAGYNYKVSTKTQFETLDNLIDTIFPNKEIKTDYLTNLATGLCGFQMENIFIATGVGGNGKSLINSLMLQCVGSYGYKLPSNLLLQPIKQGPNPEMANLHNMRFALVQEPNAERKINCSTMKELTGEKTLNVRDLYSSKCHINLRQSLFMECNDLPLLDEVNPAVNRRLRVSVFQSLFVSTSEYDALQENERKNVFVGDPYYKTDMFQDENKCVLFDILVPYFNAFRDNKFILKAMPEPCLRKCKDYMATSDNIFSWFTQYYEKSESVDNSEPIYLTDIYKNFADSDYFKNMSKNDKRKYTRKHFCEKIECNLFMRAYVKLKTKYHKGERLPADCLVGWVKTKTDEIETDEEC